MRSATVVGHEESGRGDLATLVLVGTIGATSALGGLLIDRKKAARLGDDWNSVARVTSVLPIAAIAVGRNHLAVREIGGVAVVGGAGPVCGDAPGPSLERRRAGGCGGLIPRAGCRGSLFRNLLVDLAVGRFE